ncbi:MAG: Chloroplast import component protein (Tic20) [Acidobacteria bacterium OLB17]|nr:MAG: Chloroplast import component protein (Tic20) [Acidobacteria bacterium OLB17]MCZ2390931.1 hypothetical protein [Acidobacteriota bacterium]
MSAKYDTNPLDPDFPEKAKAASAAGQTRPTPEGETRPFASVEDREQETREFGPQDFGAYQAPQESYAPAYYAAASPAAVEDPKKRRVDKVGLPENVVTALPYIPWYFGLVAGLILLILLPKSEARSRFHAAQGVAAHLGIFAISFLLGIVTSIANFARPANGIFMAVTTVMLFIFVVKAWRGRPIHLEIIEGLTDWFEEKVTPDLFSKK